MSDFLDLYERQDNLALEIGHNSVADWNVLIYDKLGRKMGDFGEPVVHVQHCDRELAIATAHVKLAEYLNENRGGY